MRMDRSKEIEALYHRVLSRIEISSAGCWVWQGTKTRKGYGQTSAKRLGQKKLYTHRIVYEHLHGPIPDGLQIDHLCRVTACCNPTHLELVTPKENTRRGLSAAKSRVRQQAVTECPRGHPYVEENVYRDARGARSCRQCRRDQNRKWTEKRRAYAALYREHTASQRAIRAVK